MFEMGLRSINVSKAPEWTGGVWIPDIKAVTGRIIKVQSAVWNPNESFYDEDGDDFRETVWGFLSFSNEVFDLKYIFWLNQTSWIIQFQLWGWGATWDCDNCLK